MWELDNRTAYPASQSWTRDKKGVHHWLVAVRATFDIVGGRLKLADKQPPPLLEPKYRGAPGITSLQEDSDLLYVKKGTDILLDASAHAPKGRPTATVPVSLRVGDLEKTLVVHGLRVYYRGALGLTTSSPRPFTSYPIVYESAFGGTDVSDPDVKKHRIDLRNPVGKGVTFHAQRLENQEAHAIEYPSGVPAKVGPAGFGPIASFWSPRLERAGTYDKQWEKSKKPLLPDDFDDRFALSAPDDQRSKRPLTGGEVVSLVNLSPEGALRFELPKIGLSLRSRILSRSEQHDATLTTVFIAPEDKKLSLVWQSTLMVPGPKVEYLDLTTIEEVPSR